jgi:6-phosphogluconolactonase (cycloisomerase 2 family)
MHSRYVAAAFIAVFLAGSAARADPPRWRDGAVFTMTDDATANAVLTYSRAPDGTLIPAASILTGGSGSGGGESVLGSQGALALSTDGHFLFVVNAGSDEVSSFRVDGAHLELVSRVSSGGPLPVSVTEHDGLVYVLDAGGAGNISGLLVDDRGVLTPLPGSRRSLGSAGSGGAQVSFDPSGDVLAVTEKAGKAISLYAVGRHGLASGPIVVPSAGAVPFGFGFTRRDVLVVSEAGGGPSGTSAVSSYALDHGALEVVSPSIPNYQRAACWLVVTRDGRFAYVANTASGDLSSYRIDRHGALTVAAEVAGTLPGGKPLDLALASRDHFLFALDAGNHAIAAFARGEDGGLVALGNVATGLPASAVGLAAR